MTTITVKGTQKEYKMKIENAKALVCTDKDIENIGLVPGKGEICGTSILNFCITEEDKTTAILTVRDCGENNIVAELIDTETKTVKDKITIDILLEVNETDEEEI